MLYIFDWDGTLCDSLSLITESIRESAKQLGLPVRTEEENRSIIGLGLVEAISTLYPELPKTERSNLVETYRQFYVASDLDRPSELYPGVIEVLDELKSRGYQLAVATGKGRKGLDRVLESMNMAEYFAYSRCADETRSKPDPLMLNQIMQESSIGPESAIMVGDTDFDLLMAKAAGVTSIGVSYGAHPMSRLKASQPDRIVDHISELL